MSKRCLKLAAALSLLAMAGPAIAECTDKEFGQFQIYGKYQEANPRIPDGQLLQLFSGRIGMQRAEFKEMYMRCATRWASTNPQEASAYLQQEQDAFATDCKKRPASDEICKVALGK